MWLGLYPMMYNLINDVLTMNNLLMYMVSDWMLS
jgi:hypothetical protein